MPRAKKPAPKPPLQVGDYFAYSCLGKYHIRLKTGSGFDGDEYVTCCSTLEGATRMAALMNQARDLARDCRLLHNHSIAGVDHDWSANWIAAFVARAVDTPHPFYIRQDHVRDMLTECGHYRGDLAKFFAHLDAAGTPATLTDFAAGVILRKQQLAIHHDRAREVVRAWRRSFDPKLPAADRAAKVLESLSPPQTASTAA